MDPGAKLFFKGPKGPLGPLGPEQSDFFKRPKGPLGPKTLDSVGIVLGVKNQGINL